MEDKRESVAHQGRNWLHRLMLALSVAEPDEVLTCFARQHPLHVEGTPPGESWHTIESCRDALCRYLAPLPPYTLLARLTGQPEVHGTGEQLRLRWPMALHLRGSTEPPVLLHVEATLVWEEERWAASYLSWYPADGDRSGWHLPGVPAASPDDH